MIRASRARFPAAPSAVLVDANVLVDVLTEDPTWFAWSAAALADAADSARLIINQLVHAELSVHAPAVEVLHEALPVDRYVRGRCRGRPDSSPAGRT